MGSGADGRMVLSRTFNAPAFTAGKKALCDMKFVKWLVLMQGTQYPTCNLVMSQLYQMITKLEMSSITYVHTARKETITIQSALEKAASPDMTKHILKERTQMVESMYEYFDAGLSESHRTKLYICTLLDPRFKNYNMWTTHKYVTIHTYAQSVCSVAKLNDRG